MSLEKESLGSRVKRDFFSAHSLILAMFYGLMLVGVASSWIFINLQFLGRTEGKIDFPSVTSLSKKLR